MMLLLTIVYSVLLNIANSETVTTDCDENLCKIERDCRCLSTASPIATSETPQFVTLTFDDAVTDLIYKQYYEPILFHLLNPDKNSISATFYVPHEYTDYERVNNLYNRGFEIAVHSVTKNPLSQYWADADINTLQHEFGGQREIISKFANIPIESIKGARTPNLQLAGNKTFEAYAASGIQYDSSWPTRVGSPLFPYTLNYISTQECIIGECPTTSFPGIWISPIININGDGKECNILTACNINGTSDEIFTWLKDEFSRTYNGNRAPLNFIVNSALYAKLGNSFDAFQRFLEFLVTLEDVFLVSNTQVINWMKNPVHTRLYNTFPDERNYACEPVTCRLQKGNEIRYMKSCVRCPSVYPWLGNPEGLKKGQNIDV